MKEVFSSSGTNFDQSVYSNRSVNQSFQRDTVPGGGRDGGRAGDDGGDGSIRS